MMPLAPHLSLPAIGHMTATAEITATDMTTSVSKPKLAFSIDSIVGRTTSSSDNSRTTETNNRLNANQKPIRHSPHSCVPSAPNPSAVNMSLMNTQWPIPLLNGSSTTSPYSADPSRQPYGQSIHPHPSHSAHLLHPSLDHPSPLTHPMLMGPSPQHYHPGHQGTSLYPWLIRSNPYAHRFNDIPFDGSGIRSFLLPPFRKAKRIRTAFSPGQLLKLEETFEKNNYVVGSERKQLASGLGLSETQVKVWFQNRRTKHKRLKHEDDMKSGGGSSSAGTGMSDKHKDSSNSVDSDEEDEVDMDDNYSNDAEMKSGAYHSAPINRDLKHHQHWYD